MIAKLERFLSIIILHPTAVFLASLLSALLLLSFAVAGFLVLATYHPLDPSFFHLSDRVPQNWLGYHGATIADLCFQSLGQSIWLLPLALFSWGVRLLRTLTLPVSALQVILLPWLVVSFATMLTFFSLSMSDWFSSNYGGHLGYILSIFIHKSLYMLGFHSPFWGSALMTITSAVLFVYVNGHTGIITGHRYWQRLREIMRITPFRRMRLQKEVKSIQTNETVVRKRKTSTVPSPAQTSKTTESVSATKVNINAPQISYGGKYQKPYLELLQSPPRRKQVVSQDVFESQARLLETVLDDFGVKGIISHWHPGPVVTSYEFEPAPGIRSSRVIALADDIARAMSAISARVSVVPGKNALGIELPNAHREVVYLRELFENSSFHDHNKDLLIALGKDINGHPVCVDLAKMPHLLIAGTTGSGKSVGVNTMILSLLYRLSPEQCRLIMIDPKMLELSIYDDIPHLLTPVVTNPKKAVLALKWAVREMEKRYEMMSYLGVRKLAAYNEKLRQARESGVPITRLSVKGFHPENGSPVTAEEEIALDSLPHIVVVVDEMADLMMVAGKEIEGTIQRLAQMARAAGIHLIMATQRPSVDVITGTIKANFPTRISFQVTSKIDSRTILGEQGAEQLLGQGDMLYMGTGARLQRVHGAFVADDEVEDIVQMLKAQGKPDYVDNVIAESDDGGLVSGEGADDLDPLFTRAVEVVRNDQKPSTSYVQRRLKIGYNRAARIIEEMEERGIISPPDHAGKRHILADA